MNIINKKLLIYPFCLLFLLIYVNLFSIDITNLIAYPVPFNPNLHKNLQITNKPGTAGVGIVDKVKIEIFDINGDPVLVREFSTINVIWNGRNNKGRVVKPGLYIIKVTLQNSASGEYSEKKIRILVNS